MTGKYSPYRFSEPARREKQGGSLTFSHRLLAARYTGLTEGIYQTDPRRMVVNKPRNVDDEDLLIDADIIEKPLDQATVMSYLIQRVRLAEVSRQLIDRNSLFVSTDGGLDYNAVLEADNELESLFNEIPPFFRLSNDKESPRIGSAASPNVAIQRYFVNSLLHSQRCRLHLPYLARGSVDPAQTYSRIACLKSASLIIQSELNLERENIPFAHTRLKLTGILYSVFMASIVLVMDMNLNARDSASQQETQREQFAHAIRMMESAARRSASAASLLQTMMAILRKGSIPSYQAVQRGLGYPLMHNAVDTRPPVQDLSQQLQPASETILEVMPSEEANFGEESQIFDTRMTDTAPTGVDMASYFDELTQSWDPRMGIDEMAWGAMFSELDASFL